MSATAAAGGEAGEGSHKNQEQPVNFVFLHHSRDAGASTLVGKMLSLPPFNYFSEKEVLAAFKLATSIGKTSSRFAYLVGADKNEYQRSITIFTRILSTRLPLLPASSTSTSCSSSSSSPSSIPVSFIDIPSHSDFLDHSFEGIALADVGVVVCVDFFPSPHFQAYTSIEQQLVAAKAAGIQKLILVLTYIEEEEPVKFASDYQRQRQAEKSSGWKSQEEDEERKKANHQEGSIQERLDKRAQRIFRNLFRKFGFGSRDSVVATVAISSCPNAEKATMNILSRYTQEEKTGLLPPEKYGNYCLLEAMQMCAQQISQERFRMQQKEEESSKPLRLFITRVIASCHFMKKNKPRNPLFLGEDANSKVLCIGRVDQGILRVGDFVYLARADAVGRVISIEKEVGLEHQQQGEESEKKEEQEAKKEEEEEEEEEEKSTQKNVERRKQFTQASQGEIIGFALEGINYKDHFLNPNRHQDVASHAYSSSSSSICLAVRHFVIEANFTFHVPYRLRPQENSLVPESEGKKEYWHKQRILQEKRKQEDRNNKSPRALNRALKKEEKHRKQGTTKSWCEKEKLRRSGYSPLFYSGGHHVPVTFRYIEKSRPIERNAQKIADYWQSEPSYIRRNDQAILHCVTRPGLPFVVETLEEQQKNQQQEEGEEHNSNNKNKLGRIVMRDSKEVVAVGKVIAVNSYASSRMLRWRERRKFLLLQQKTQEGSKIRQAFEIWNVLVLSVRFSNFCS